MFIYSEETVVFAEIILCLLMDIILEFDKLTPFLLNTICCAQCVKSESLLMDFEIQDWQ
jgi:hypothetical protein